MGVSMNKILSYLKVLIIPIVSFLLIPLILSLFNLFGIGINKIILIIISAFVMFISGFIIGKKQSKKGFISGLILGGIFILFLIIMGLFFKLEWNFGRFIYYIILIMSSMLGSIIGINKKKS